MKKLFCILLTLAMLLCTIPMSVTVSAEDETAPLPPEVCVIREVTEEPLYKNTNIARFLKEHPGEPLPV